jgi:flagellar hook-associated protein 1
VSAGRAGVIVSLGDAYQFKVLKGQDADGNPKNLVYTTDQRGMPQMNVTNNFDSGKVGGLVHVRDKFITKVLDRVDTLAFGFANTVNDVHSKAFTQAGKTGIKFFELDEGRAAAESIRVSDALNFDVNNIATGQIPFAPGDNRGVLDVIGTQDMQIFDEGSTTMGDFMSGTIGTIGVEAKATNDTLEVQSSIMGQLETLREAESGVSLDEEAIDMLRFQKAFDANAKMIQVADSMMETVLSLKRF